MTADRAGDWMQTYTGRQFWPLDPRTDEICVLDIAHALAMQCRFAGHCREFYSVAQHSVLVSSIVPSCDALAGLLHDASEAYLVDIPRPVKHQPMMSPYREAEHALEQIIAARFSVIWPLPESVREADEILLATEQRDMMVPPPSDWHLRARPHHLRIDPWVPERAEKEFLTRFHELATVAC